MQGRVGTVDRLIRIAVGVAALGAGLTHTGVAGGWAYAADLVGVIALATGLTGKCPLYGALHIGTSRRHA